MFSKDYDTCLKECTEHHARSKTFSGSLVLPHAQEIKDLIKEFDVKCILDYGCGKGVQYEGEQSLEVFWGVPVTKYDPAVPKYENVPEGVFDLVICSHVLMWLPKEDIETVKRIMASYTLGNGIIYIANKIAPVKKQILSNPSACPREWEEEDWYRAFTQHYDKETYIVSLERPTQNGRVARVPTWRSR